MKRFVYSVSFIFCALSANVCVGELVDFENAASFGGDDALVTESYFGQYGLSVTATAGNDAASATTADLYFEAEGRDGTDGFWSSNQGRDEAFSGDLGNYLLKAGNGDLSYGKSKYFNMSIAYKNATQAASGEIWDIDGKEQYKVTALDANDNAIASLTSPIGSLNAEPWTWSFDVGDKAGISTIQVEFIAEESTLRGFAFDNFNATEANVNATSHAAPLPNAFAMGMVGLVFVSYRRWQKKAEIHVVD